MELIDYQCWKAAYIISPSYFSIFEVGLSLGSNDLIIQNVLADMKSKFKNNLESRQYFWMCLYRIILREKNKQGDNFRSLIEEKFSELGYEEEIDAVLRD